MLKDWGLKRIKIICILASESGINALHQAHPDVQIYVGQIDPILNDVRNSLVFNFLGFFIYVITYGRILHIGWVYWTWTGGCRWSNVQNLTRPKLDDWIYYRAILRCINMTWIKNLDGYPLDLISRMRKTTRLMHVHAEVQPGDRSASSTLASPIFTSEICIAIALDE